MKTKRVLKYATGQEIPANAKYLSTQVETQTGSFVEPDGTVTRTQTNLFVWHYYEVEGEIK